MELADIIQYTHKIKKIKITNENKQSMFSFVIIKITLPSRDDETVRFSLEPDKDFLEHQSIYYKEKINIFLNNSFDDGLQNWHTDANNYWTISEDGLDGNAAKYPQKSLRATLYQNINLDNIKSISFYVKSTANTEISLLLDNVNLVEENQITVLDDDEWTRLEYNVMEYSGVHQIKFLSIPKYGELLLDDFQCELIKDKEVFVTSTNDYYCRIPNKLNDVSYIYAHFLPKDLYTYENEVMDFVSFYDFKDIFENASISKNRYENSIDDKGRLVVQSTDSQSVDGYHNPNYKQYTDIDNYKNKTKQGQFPLSSKYRSNQDWEVPNLSDPYPKWTNNTDAPEWEVRIPFEDISGPINVFLNYEYLPTSREYHQHYYGFEGEKTERKTINVFEGTNINTIDGKFGSKNNYRIINYNNPYDDRHSFYVPHENTIPINLDENEINISRNSQRELTCKWEKNWCYDYYIFTPLQTTNNDEKYCYKSITLKSGKYYSLRYYIYIPSYISIEDDKGYISVVVDGIEYKIDSRFIRKDKELRDQWIYHEVPFLAGSQNIIKFVGPQKLVNNNQIFFINLELQEMVEYSPTIQYNETGVRVVEQNQSTFKSIAEYTENTILVTSENNIIQKDQENIFRAKIRDESNIPISNQEIKFWNDWDDDSIFNVNITPGDAIGYGDDFSSTLQVEKSIIQTLDPNNFYATIKDKNNIPIEDVEVYFYHTDEIIEKKETKLPIPYSDIVINSEDEKYVYYDPKTTNLYCVHPTYTDDETHIMRYDSETNDLYVIKNDEDISFSFSNDTLYGAFQQKLTGVYGPNNIFVFKFMDTEGHAIEDGTVEIGIFMSPDEYDTDIGYAAVKVTQYPAKVTGTMYFNVDLTHLEKNSTDPDNKYYIRLKYKNPCRIFDKIVFKPLYVYDETITIECVQINDSSTNKSGQSIISNGYYIDDIDQFPLKISACIKDQKGALKENGYCELSIDDELNQSTIVDKKHIINDNLIDEYGHVDFYLDFDDLKVGHQTIKIEYYREYYNALGFIYFDLELKEIDLKPAVPIDVKILKKGETHNINNNYYMIQPDDCVLSTITTNNHSKFRIEVYCDDQLIKKKNVYNATDSTIDFLNTTYGNWKSHKFTIKTGNMQDANGNDIDDLYRDYVRSFVIAYPLQLSVNKEITQTSDTMVCTAKLNNSNPLENINKVVKFFKL